jgi:dTDP-glucose 4,6-dehydratase
MTHSDPTSPHSLLITGGAGFIGSNFVRYWHHHHPQDSIVVLDALTYAGNRESLSDLEPQGVTFCHGNINDRPLIDHLCETHHIDCLVHFAAESHVDRSITHPGAFIETNVVGTFTLLEAFYRHWSRAGKPDHFRFHHISTDEVFGSLSATDPAFCETTPYAPNSPYSASKAGSDHLVRAYHHTYGLPTLITNCSNNYGPYQFPEKLIPLIIVNILEGKPLPVYGDGQNVRDWLYVEDHCRAIDRVLTAGHPGETYGIGGEAEVRNIDLVNSICTLMDGKVNNLKVHPCHQLIQFVTDRPGHDRRYAMNIHKIQTRLGWTPQVTLQEGLEKTIDWYLAHRQWWQPLLKCAVS